MKTVDVNLLVQLQSSKRKEYLFRKEKDEKEKIDKIKSTTKEEFLEILLNHKEEIQKVTKDLCLKDDIFKEIVGDKNIEYIIEWHLQAWYNSRINGLSNGFAFNYESPQVISLFDNIIFNR